MSHLDWPPISFRLPVPQLLGNSLVFVCFSLSTKCKCFTKMTVFHQIQRMPPNCIALTEPLCNFPCERIKLFILGRIHCSSFVKMLRIWINFLHLQSVIYSCIIHVAPSIVSKIWKLFLIFIVDEMFFYKESVLLFFTYRLTTKSRWGRSQPCYLRKTTACLSCCFRLTPACLTVLAVSKKSPLRAKTTPARDCQASPPWTRLSRPKAQLHCPLKKKMLSMVREKPQ